VSWVGPSVGTWNTPANWSPSSPGAGDGADLFAFDTILNTGTFDLQSLTGTGRLRITGGTLTLSAASSIGRQEQTAGTLGGTGALTVAGDSTWSGGAMTPIGTTSFAGVLALSGNGTRLGSAAE
jgi:hypothetical protein